MLVLFLFFLFLKTKKIVRKLMRVLQIAQDPELKQFTIENKLNLKIRSVVVEQCIIRVVKRKIKK